VNMRRHVVDVLQHRVAGLLDADGLRWEWINQNETLGVNLQDVYVEVEGRKLWPLYRKVLHYVRHGWW
jgi:hypothetical protein